MAATIDVNGKVPAPALPAAWRKPPEFPMLCRSAPETPVAKVVLASALARWLPQTAAGDGGEVSLDVPGSTVADALAHLFALHPVLRGYVVDERGALRRHVALFVDGNAIHHNSSLQQAIGEHAEVHVMQALSGG